jgi:UDP-N-acetyl-D-mannosaminuronate dehydrogenase
MSVFETSQVKERHSIFNGRVSIPGTSTALGPFYIQERASLQFGASLTDNARVINYNRNVFIIQATGYILSAN